MRKKWEEAPRITQITKGSILYWADEADPDWRKRYADERRRAQIERNREIGDDIGELFPAVLSLQDMNDRLVYIRDTGAVADRVTGFVCKKDNMKTEYAASRHGRGPAIMRWLESTCRVGVEVLAWVPGSPRLCRALEENKRAFNTWYGLPPMPYPEDWQKQVESFVEHVKFLVPVEKECTHFLQWLGHIVQRPEVLPHTCYLMITPITGTGRNLLASILTRVLRGFVASGVPLAEVLDIGAFTGRLTKKLLAIVDEVREGSSERRYQRAESLKRIITEEHREINPKYGLRSLQKNCCRWLMFSNHEDAIPFDNNDRRIRVVTNPETPNSAQYYTDLYTKVDDPDFIGSVRHYLETLSLAGFAPGEHAPMNAAKESALDAMKGEIERVIDEFKSDCLNKPDDWDMKNPNKEWKPRELTSRERIKDIVKDANRGVNVHDKHLTRAIKNAGMVIVPRPEKGGRRLQWDGGYYAIVIIDPKKWTLKQVLDASGKELAVAMGLPQPD